MQSSDNTCRTLVSDRRLQRSKRQIAGVFGGLGGIGAPAGMMGGLFINSSSPNAFIEDNGKFKSCTVNSFSKYRHVWIQNLFLKLSINMEIYQRWRSEIFICQFMELVNTVQIFSIQTNLIWVSSFSQSIIIKYGMQIRRLHSGDLIFSGNYDFATFYFKIHFSPYKWMCIEMGFRFVSVSLKIF